MSAPVKPTSTTAMDTAPVNKGGRPRVSDEPMTTLSVRVPSPTYDRLVRRANMQDESVASLVRQLLILRLS